VPETHLTPNSVAKFKILLEAALSAQGPERAELARLYRVSSPLPALKDAGAIVLGPADPAQQCMAAWVIPGGFNLERAQSAFLALLNSGRSAFPDLNAENLGEALIQLQSFLSAPPDPNPVLLLSLNTEGQWIRCATSRPEATLSAKPAVVLNPRPEEPSRVLSFSASHTPREMPAKPGSATPRIKFRGSKLAESTPPERNLAAQPPIAAAAVKPAVDPAPPKVAALPEPARSAPAIEAPPLVQVALTVGAVPAALSAPLIESPASSVMPLRLVAPLKVVTVSAPKPIKIPAAITASAPRAPASFNRPVEDFLVETDSTYLDATTSESEAQTPLFMQLAERLLGNRERLSWSIAREKAQAPFIDVLTHAKHPGVVVLLRGHAGGGVDAAAFLMQVRTGLGILREELLKNIQMALDQRAREGAAVKRKAGHFVRPAPVAALEALRTSLSALYAGRGRAEVFQSTGSVTAVVTAKVGVRPRKVRAVKGPLTRHRKSVAVINFMGATPVDPEVLKFYKKAQEQRAKG
jgi:hypothetical protein